MPEIDQGKIEKDWRAALLVEYVAVRLAAEGMFAWPDHSYPSEARCEDVPGRPLCATCALSHITVRLAAGSPDEQTAVDWAQAHELAARSIRAVVDDEMQESYTETKKGLRNLAAVHRSGVSCPAWPEIRGQAADILGTALPRFTCWRCAASTASPVDIRRRFCVKCLKTEVEESDRIPPDAQ